MAKSKVKKHKGISPSQASNEMYEIGKQLRKIYDDLDNYDGNESMDTFNFHLLKAAQYTVESCATQLAI